MNADQSLPNDVVQDAEVSPVAQQQDTQSKEPGRREPTQAFTAFKQQLEAIESVEDKIGASLLFMKESLSKYENPRFRDFWDARKECLPLFKQQIVQKQRTTLWQEYIDISTEARRLKEVLDEQSAFAFEQIELAIASLQAELDSYESLVEKASLMEIPAACPALSKNAQKYQQMQRSLHVLNNFAARINSLRKEVIRTEMRVKNKNRLFEKLSAAGHCVFPKRKELIKECSELFSNDVMAFVDKHFSDDVTSRPALHQLREEIKALQNIAKDLTLNPQSFNTTRLKLSECWDKLKVIDKERKKEISHKKQQMKENAQQVIDKIKEFELLCQGDLSYSDAAKQSEEILSFMKTLELSFQEQKMLKDQLFAARAPVYEKQRAEAELKEKKEKEHQLEKRKSIDTFKEELTSLLSTSEQLCFEEMLEKKDEILARQPSSSLSKLDKMEIDKLLRLIADKIDDKKEKKIISLSDSDQERLSQLEDLLEEKKITRNEIKAQLESYRKILGGSGFDFEKAMMYRDLIEAEKERLDKVSSSIEEIELKISEIEG